ncbi:MAG TPA: dipeptide epimerase [Thermoanaerobaculia bacterium]|nr:dipeptide epimerase [Thermoanaerobaculia bacterium]
MIELRHHGIELALRHPFGLSRGVSTVRHNLVVELEHEGLVGLGEAAPIARYGQDRESARRAVEAMAPRLGDPRHFDGAAREAALAAAVPGQDCAEAALDIALHDLAGKRCGVPLYQLWGLDSGQVPLTSFTIAMDTPEVVAEKVREAAEFEILKVKLGGPEDRALIEAVRSVTDRPLRVDANEGWTFEQARELLPWLAEMGVELVEQPLPAAQLAEMRELRRSSPLPLFADESVHRAADVPRLAGAFDGINVKLMKCGGPGEALRMIHVARAHGLQVMLGCMIESSIAITAAAHLSPLVDHADLDGHLLVTNDPYLGATLRGGRLVPPDGPGLGVVPRP